MIDPWFEEVTIIIFRKALMQESVDENDSSWEKKNE